MALAFGRKAQLTAQRTAAALTLAAGSLLAATPAHAQGRGLLAAPDTLSAPLLAQYGGAPAQGDPNAQPAAPVASPSGAPAATGAGGPAINISGNNPAPGGLGASNQPQKDAPGAEKKKPGMSFYDRIAGSAIFVQTGTTIGTVFKGYQDDYNPNVSTYGLLLPRFAISKDWQIRGRVGGNFEYTDSDATTYSRELELTDTNLQLFYRGIPAVGGKVKLMPFVGALLPTSKASRSRTMIVGPSVGVQAAMPIEHFLGGEAILIGILTYSRPIYRYQTPNGLDERPYQANCAGAASGGCGAQLSGVTNARDSITSALIFAPEWGWFSPGAFLLVNNQYAFAPKNASSTLPNGQEPTQWRASSYFSFWFDFHVSEWITPEIGYQQQRSLRDLDGSFGNPFWSKNQDQVVYLGCNIQIDSLLKKLSGQDGQAGVVRAKAAPTPVRFF